MIKAGTIYEAISARSTWEQRQRTLYQMRREGLRRRNKPYANAADLHFKLIDTVIEKFKPFYYNQVFSNPKLAQFVSTNAQDTARTAESVGEWFDYVLREETNFEKELLHGIDAMCVHAHGIIKCYWDSENSTVRFENVNPLYLVVPQGCIELDEADWFCHIRHLSVGQYKRDPSFKPEVLDQIKGGTSEGVTEFEQERKQVEGITYTKNQDEILVWEVYEKVSDGWIMSTVAPNNESVKVRDDVKITYKVNESEGKPLCPFVDLFMEVTEKGWFAARGLAERVAAFEAYLCKIWNCKADFLDYTSKPIFSTTQPLSNKGNFKFLPGEVLPNGLQPVQFPTPPISLDQEMIATRQAAESTISMPDFGIGGNDSGKDNKTATEVDYLRTLSTTGVDLKGRIFRIGLRKLYGIAYAVLRFHKRDSLAYFLKGDLKNLDGTALQQSYKIVPDGSPDDWNKVNRYQKAMARFQAFQGHPNINQEALVQDVLDADDSRKTDELFISTQLKAANESEDEAFELLLLEAGWPAQANPTEDHVTRIKILIQRLQALQAIGEQVNPMARQRIQEHIAQHLQMLQQVNPQLAKQVIQGLVAMEQQQAQPMPQQPMPMEVVQ